MAGFEVQGDSAPQCNRLRPRGMGFALHGASTAHGRQRVVTASGLASTECNVLKKFRKVNTKPYP